MKRHKLYFTDYQIRLLIEAIDDINDDPAMSLPDEYTDEWTKLCRNLDSISDKLRSTQED